VVKLYPHQTDALKETAGKNRVAYYHDMGLGKTFTGGEKMTELGATINLVICQKSKINDWYEHFKSNYDVNPCDLTKVKASELKHFIEVSHSVPVPSVYIINYELAFRRPELTKLKDFTLMLDESSLIQNETAKRSKFILNKLKPANVILLSGTPTGGKYERLYSQLKLLGWNISKTTYWNTYIDYHFEDMGGFPVRFIDGYKNVDRLKRKMRELGCHFLKTEDVLELPDQIFTTVKVPVSKEYRKFRKDRVVEVGGTQLVGDNTLTKMLYERQLCGQYSKDKLEAFRDLVESTEDRLIVFYNFTSELDNFVKPINEEIKRPVSIVNGQYKDLTAYEECANSITFIQYQAGAMGLNLQKANKIIYYSPPLSSELYEQSKKRINRIGQNRTCYYYNLTVTGSIEERIYNTLAMRRDYTEALFENES
jgi:SNF2 family DNA or RNA helicase